MIWQDRALYISPIKYALCISEKKFRKELKRLKIDRDVEFTKDGLDATTHYFRRKIDNTECCIICLKENPEIELLQVYGLLVHEAVHI